MKKKVRYTPTLTQESLEKIKNALEKINEQMQYNPPSRPKLTLIRGGKS